MNREIRYTSNCERTNQIKYPISCGAGEKPAVF